MSWLIIVLAGVFEILWAVGLKLNVGFQRPVLLLFTVLSIGLSIGLLALAMKHLPLGTAYAVWTGIGVIGAFIVGILFFEESASIGRIASVLLITAGLVGLKVTAQH
ncbi:MAG: SMR family transporter [Candidatus Melainabacteria bacterium]|nr:SMR family transporter [Candidatus Melainabacteria bacterium]